MEPSCEIAGVDGPAIGIGQEDTAYLDSSTRSFGICCRVQGPPGYIATWLRNGEPIPRGQQGYHFGEGYLRFSGSLHNGCAKYTCQVEFTVHGSWRKESTTICAGGMGFFHFTELYDCMSLSGIAPPTAVRITGEMSVLENTHATYLCSSDGYPEPTKM